MSDLPKYFVTENGSTYKLYMNTIYQTNTNINVLWPIVNVRVNNLTARLSDNETAMTYIRKWNGEEYTLCEWNYTGSSVEVCLLDSLVYVTAPVIHMNIDCLPFNPSKFCPNDMMFVDEIDMTAYVAANIYRTDPAASENMMAIRSYTPVAEPVVEHVTMVKTLPPHITKIVLADAIIKNEICPITSENITYSNATVTVCGHVFCSSAIDKWLASPSSKGLCPTCRCLCV